MIRLLTTTLVLLVSAAHAQAQEIGNATAGENLAMAVCANCHLVREGQSKPPMDSVPSFDAISHDQNLTDERLRGFLNRPHPPMPNIELSRQQIADLVSYLRSRH